jgi:dienelactone hydrolase
MRSKSLASVAAVAIIVGAAIAFPTVLAAQTPPMAGGYSNITPVPVEDSQIRAIAGALIKPVGPVGSGPFPVVILTTGCRGLDAQADLALQKVVINHMTARGFATFILDPFTPRNEQEGVCAALNEKTFARYLAREADDILAAIETVRAMPGIDPKLVFLEGHAFGAMSSLAAVDSGAPRPDRRADVAGVIAYYPLCFDTINPSVPTLVMNGDKDDWTPAAACQAAATGKLNVELAIVPGATHGFDMPGITGEFMGHHMVYDSGAAADARQRADAFITAHLEPRSGS